MFILISAIEPAGDHTGRWAAAGSQPDAESSPRQNS